MVMARRFLCVEGGGDHNQALKIECRKGFRQLIEAAGCGGKMPRIVACGDRRQAYESFRSHIGSDKCERAWLLVDSEDPIGPPDAISSWVFVAQRPADGWPKPDGASDDDLHFMAQCMESWFLADREALEKFFGSGFLKGALPKRSDVENIAKRDVYDVLDRATDKTKTKGGYGKGEHSFKLLALLNPSRVESASPWAKRFFESIRDS